MLPEPLQSFPAFYALCCKRFVPGHPEPTRTQIHAARHLAYGKRKRGLLGYRGMGKSTLVGSYIPFRLALDPNTKFVVASKTQDHAKRITRFSLNVLESLEWTQHLAPQFDDRGSVCEFDVAGTSGRDPAIAASVTAFGIEGQVAGSRADVLILDDIETEVNSATEIGRAMLREKRALVFHTLKRNGEVVYIGTPYRFAPDTIYADLLDHGYEVLCWPIQYPTAEEVELYSGALNPFIAAAVAKDPGLAGSPCDPELYSREECLDRLAEGKTTFLMQDMVLLHASAAMKLPLRQEDAIVTDLTCEDAPDRILTARSPQTRLSDLPNFGVPGDFWHAPGYTSLTRSPYTSVIMTIDESGRGKAETAYAIVGMLHSTLFVLDAGGSRDGYERHVLEAMASAARSFGVRLVLYEGIMGSGMFGSVFQPVLEEHFVPENDPQGRPAWRCGLDPLSDHVRVASAQKEARILSVLEPVFQGHRIVFNRALVKKEEAELRAAGTNAERSRLLFYQVCRIEARRGCLPFYDRIDALAQAVSYWTPALASSQSKSAERTHADRRMKEQEAFLREMDPVYRSVHGRGLVPESKSFVDALGPFYDPPRR